MSLVNIPCVHVYIYGGCVCPPGRKNLSHIYRHSHAKALRSGNFCSDGTVNPGGGGGAVLPSQCVLQSLLVCLVTDGNRS